MRKFPVLGPDDPRHGTFNGYNNCGCRCIDCKAANVEKMKELREQRQAKIDPDDPRHGTLSFYFNHSCRCDLCKEANRLYAAERSAARRSSSKKPRILPKAKAIS